jgi:hypothetical protein
MAFGNRTGDSVRTRNFEDQFIIPRGRSSAFPNGSHASRFLAKVGHVVEVQVNAQLELKRVADLFNLSQPALSVMTAQAEAQEAKIAAYRDDVANLNGMLAEVMTAYELIVRSRSWRLTQPLRSAVTAAARRLSQILRRGKMGDS